MSCTQRIVPKATRVVCYVHSTASQVLGLCLALYGHLDHISMLHHILTNGPCISCQLLFDPRSVYYRVAVLCGKIAQNMRSGMRVISVNYAGHYAGFQANNCMLQQLTVQFLLI